MRVAVISAPRVQGDPLGCAQALAKGMESMGHQVDIIDVWTGDGFRLPAYGYVALATEPLSFFSGKIPYAIPKFLSTGSGLVGKKSAAFVKKNGILTARALANLMMAMEKEGMMVNWSEVLLNHSQAEAMGKRIGA